MSESLKNIRLNKAATAFNVGIANIVEFLSKKGHHIDNNPNTKITSEMYDLLAGEFQSERKVKEEAQKINISGNKEQVAIEAVRQEEMPNEQEKDIEISDIIIKNYAATSDNKAIAKPAPAPKPVEEATLVAAEEQEAAPEEVKPEIPVEENSPSEDRNPQKQELKIIDKIDLSAINSKSRPDKKTKEEKKKEADDFKKAKEEKKQQVRKEEPVVEKQIEKPAKVETKAVEPVKEEKQPEAVKPQEKQAEVIEHIGTNFPTLNGPKVLGKIELPVFKRTEKKPEASSAKSAEELNKKNKRKRLKKSPSPQENTNTGTRPATAQHPNQSNPNSNSNSNQNKSKWKDKRGSKETPNKVPITADEIEKQMKETLARLSPIGKSKASVHRREKRKNVNQQIEEEHLRQEENKKVLQVTEFVTANELANMMEISVTQVIQTCLSVGIFVSINQRLDAEAIQLIADEFGFKLDFVSADVVGSIQDVEEVDKEEDLVSRPPIVTVMGHVDHGKTSLLDSIRNANVIAGEAGGITQHIGAYEVELEDGRKITFLDTPGHEAFTAMRARGAKSTDIAIIVIAADDRIMPQTIEAINHAQAANVPLVFAINKVDKPSANPDKIKEELANMNLLVEEWGGKYQSQDISAKKGLNIKELLEKVLLEAELLELKGNPNKRAKGTIIESSLDKGRGYVAKILVQDGSISIGDPVVAGSIYGRVKAMYNERNKAIQTAGPSTPVLLLGLNGAPQAGDTFNVMAGEKEAKEIATRRQQLQREQGIRTQKHITLDEIGRRIAIGDFKQLNLIVKGDVDGSIEALSDSLLKLSTEEVQVNIIHKSVGQITESDVLLATASNAIIIGFQVRPSVSARKLAETEQIDIRLYSIIYNAINEIRDAIEGMLSPQIEEKIVCNLEVREVFKITKVGTIAGCFCLDGKMSRSTKVRVIRDGIVVYTGKLASLKRFKDEVKEVVSGQDCGLNIENFNDIKVGDIVEGYDQTEVKRKL